MLMWLTYVWSVSVRCSIGISGVGSPCEATEIMPSVDVERCHSRDDDDDDAHHHCDGDKKCCTEHSNDNRTATISDDSDVSDDNESLRSQMIKPIIRAEIGS